MSNQLVLQLLLLTLLTQFSSAAVSSDITQEYCKQQLLGAWIGGHCFFIPTPLTNTDWAGAWAACEKWNATLAQVHTSMEYTAIGALANFDNSQTCWIGLQTTSSASDPSCAIPLATTYWFDGVSTQNNDMSVSKTWVRYHSCGEDEDKGNENYHMVSRYNKTTRFIDVDSTGRSDWMANYPLCQIASCSRTFSKGSKCMNESPILTLGKCASLQECVQSCGNQLWCRSLDYTPTIVGDQMGPGKCELFSFSGLEPAATGPSMGSKNNCLHYDNDMS